MKTNKNKKQIKLKLKTKVYIKLAIIFKHSLCLSK